MLYAVQNNCNEGYLVWDSDDLSVELVSEETIRCAVSDGIVFENVSVESHDALTYLKVNSSKILDKEFYVKSQDLHLYFGREYFVAHREKQGIILPRDSLKIIGYVFHLKDNELDVGILFSGRPGIIVNIGIFDNYKISSNLKYSSIARSYSEVSWSSLLSKCLFR